MVLQSGLLCNVIIGEFVYLVGVVVVIYNVKVNFQIQFLVVLKIVKVFLCVVYLG